MTLWMLADIRNRSLLTTTEAEATYTDTRDTTSDNRQANRSEFRVHVIPDLTSANERSLLCGVGSDLIETRQCNLHAGGRTESGISGVTSSLDSEWGLVRGNDFYLKVGRLFQWDCFEVALGYLRLQINQQWYRVQLSRRIAGCWMVPSA